MNVNGFTFDGGVTFKKYNYNSLDNLPDLETGTYPNMAVGSIIGTNKVTDTEPYKLRASKSIGDRAFDTLVGGTVAWNQLLPDGTRANTSNGVSYTRAEKAPYILNGTANGQAVFVLNTTSCNAISGHKYLITGGKSSDVYTQLTTVSVWGGSNPQDHGSGKIANAVANGIFDFALIVKDGTTVTNESVNPQLFDLTTLFGSTIADYIYSLEQATAGAGVAWVRRYLTEEYYAYCAPTLKHVTGVSAHVMRDANDNVIGNYAIDSTWTGMGIPKLVDGKLKFDGDIYPPSGECSDRYGIVDLGTLDYTYDGVFSAVISDMKANPYTSENLMCAKYPTMPMSYGSFTYGIRYAGGNHSIGIKDPAYSDAATFKTAMNGVYLVYEKQTPTTSTKEPFTSPQIVDDFGTEEYVTTGLVPVGHETQYPENLADKISDLPALPTTAGEYRLNVTVTGGVPSYSWVSA